MDFYDGKKGLINKLGLDQFYPAKITLHDVIGIEKHEEPLSVKTLAWVFLKKLIMLNADARDETVNTVSSQTKTKGSSDTKSLEGFFAALTGSSTGNTAFSPLDIFLVIYQCCDLILRQTLLQKMYLCKLALPFIISDAGFHISLWSLRSITLSHRTDDEALVETSAVDLDCHIVSVLRFGETKLQTSNLLNEILFANKHKSFHDRQCLGGATPAQLCDGYVEGIWFESTDVHEVRPTLYLNLQGDGYRSEVMQKVCKISSVVVVLVDVENFETADLPKEIEYIHNGASKVIFVLGTKSQSPNHDLVTKAFTSCQQKTGKARVQTVFVPPEGKNVAQICSEIKPAIKAELQTTGRISYKEAIEKVKNEKRVFFDELDNACSSGKVLANEVILKIKDKDIHKQRHELLPLQGKSWIELSSYLKKEKRFKEDETMADKDKLKRKRYDINSKREQIVKNRISPFIQQFIKNLREASKDEKQLHFFLAWLKLFLQEITRTLLPKLKLKRNRHYDTYRSAKEEGEKSESELEELRLELEKADNKVSDGQLTLEHLFREIGQLYEVFATSRKDINKTIKSQICEMPGIFAALLLKGYSFEIMDGEAFNIPMIWVETVLRKLCTEGKDANIFVVSVLGVQSSGKSTFLNAMFGTEFPTSAGRCTKGVYVRLMPIAKRCKPELGFRHVLVVDTEGMRAIELSKLTQSSRDNELAALTLGLADITAVVIKGENLSDVKDVLQIDAHAFLRMKIANKDFEMRQKCVFIHNNVSQNAKQDLEHGQHQLVELLDKMIVEAANQEDHCQIKTFKEVIDFNETRDIFYVPDLWKGDPPSAPVNPGYSNKIQEIKEFLIKRCNPYKLLKISELVSRITDVWQAILADDFIYSFRSTLEAKAFSALERQYANLVLDLENDVIMWLGNDAQIAIETCLSDRELTECSGRLKLEIEKQIREKAKSVEEDLVQFCERNWQEYLEHYKQYKINALQYHINAFSYKQQVEIESLKTTRKFDLEQPYRDQHLLNQFFEESQRIVERYRNQTIDPNTLNGRWEDMWKNWVRDIHLPVKSQEQVDSVMENALLKVFHENHRLITMELERIPIKPESRNLQTTDRHSKLKGSISQADIKEDEHLSVLKNPKRSRFTSWFSRTDCKADGAKVANTILRKVDDEIDRHRRQKTGFKEQFINSLLKIVASGVEKHNKQSSTYKFLPTFRVFLAAHVCRRTYKFYSDKQKDYDNNYGVTGKLDRLKPMAYKAFIAIVSRSQEQKIAEIFWDSIRSLVISRIEQILPYNVVLAVLKDFSGMKAKLIREILEHLLKKESFEDYMAYINDPKLFALEYITLYIDEKWLRINPETKTSKYTEEACKESEKSINKLLRCLPDPEDVDFPDTMEQWVKEFCEKARNSKLIGITDDMLRHIANSSVADIRNFTAVAANCVSKLEDAVKNHFLLEVKQVQLSLCPEQSVFERLWGCEAQCPFCFEPCRESDVDHIKFNIPHRCVQHRPAGVAGSLTADEKLVLETCNFRIQSNSKFSCYSVGKECRKSNECRARGDYEEKHPFREYKTYFKDWEIPPSSEPDGGSKYWCYFMKVYKDQLAEEHFAEQQDNLHSFEILDVEAALCSLREAFDQE